MDDWTISQIFITTITAITLFDLLTSIRNRIRSFQNQFPWYSQTILIDRRNNGECFNSIVKDVFKPILLIGCFLFNTFIYHDSMTLYILSSRLKPT